VTPQVAGEFTTRFCVTFKDLSTASATMSNAVKIRYKAAPIRGDREKRTSARESTVERCAVHDALVAVDDTLTGTAAFNAWPVAYLTSPATGPSGGARAFG